VPCRLPGKLRNHHAVTNQLANTMCIFGPEGGQGLCGVEMSYMLTLVSNVAHPVPCSYLSLGQHDTCCNSIYAMYDKQEASPTALHQKGCSSPARPVPAAAAAQIHIAAVDLLRLLCRPPTHTAA
jgi:hypothetical protein